MLRNKYFPDLPASQGVFMKQYLHCYESKLIAEQKYLHVSGFPAAFDKGIGI